MDPLHFPFGDVKAVAYVALSSLMGTLSALASLLGQEGKPLTRRVVAAYLLSGGLVSCGVTLLLATHYGFSHFLLGVSIFAGYKALDTLAIVGMAISGVVNKIFSWNGGNGGKPDHAPLIGREENVETKRVGSPEFPANNEDN